MSTNYLNAVTRVGRRTKTATKDLVESFSSIPDLERHIARLDQRISGFSHRLKSVDEKLDAILGQPDRVATSARSNTGNGTSTSSSGVEQADPMASTAQRISEIIDGIQSGRIPPEKVSDNFSSSVTGLSGRKFRTLVARLVQELGHAGDYLEIGIYQGKTLCTSAALNPTVRHLGVDDYSFDTGDDNRKILEELVSQQRLSNVDIVEANFFDWLPERSQIGQRDVAVFYFDASHDYRSQFVALLHGAKIVVPGGVMLVDDCNYSHVRAATYDFCDLNPDWALIFEEYTGGHPDLAKKQTRLEMQDGWWNGVHVLIHDPLHKVPRLGRQSEPRLERFFLSQHRPENCATDMVESRLATPRA